MDENFILKANLFEHGIQITPSAKKLLDNLSDIWLMDDYITCSGVTLKYENYYVTAGVDNTSKYKLTAKNNNFFICYDEKSILAYVITPPDYMRDELIIKGQKITTYVNTYTDRVRIQLMSGCANRCKFCNATEFKYFLNPIDGIEEALAIALSQSDVKHALISSGSVREEHLEKITDMYSYFGRNYEYLSPDIMMTPRGFTSYTDVTQYEEYINYLKSTGIAGLSINMELNNKKSSIRTEKLVKDYGKRRVVKGVNIGLESGLGIF